MSRWAALLLAGIAGAGAGAAATSAAQDASGRAGIEAIVRDYLLQHPEIIPEAMARLREKETAQLIAADRTAIERPFAGAWAGNPKGDITLVMFTDYACGYCRASSPDLDRLLREDPGLRVVWREIPVLGPDSEAAARVALAAAKQDGRYPALHRAIFAGGRADAAHVAAAAKASGVDPARLAAERNGTDVLREVDANLQLAARLGVTGTPAFVVGHQLLPGAVGHDKLAAAIAEARKRT